MTIQELKDKLKDDSEALSAISELEKKINTNFVEDNIKLKQENEKLKSDNLVLYNQIMNKGATEEDSAPISFKDYTEDIIKALKK